MKSLFILCAACLTFSGVETYGNNATYIGVSGQVARKKQLDIVANNVANAHSIGFEQDKVVFKQVNLKQNQKRHNSFVKVGKLYRDDSLGPLKRTGNPLDLTIIGQGYFKVRTDRGVRYSLNGSGIINSQGVLVNFANQPFLDVAGEAIEIPAEYTTIVVDEIGRIIVDKEEIAQIGIFAFVGDPVVQKEGGSLYNIQGDELLLEEPTVVAGHLRESNVNSALAMVEMVELQRSHEAVTGLISNMAELESSVISKLSK